MKTTTFNQVINGEVFTITVPQNRVEALINRTDRLLFKNKLSAARDVIAPFIGAAPVVAEVVVQGSPEACIEETRGNGRFFVIGQLVSKFGFTKSQAYYRVRKAGL